MQIAIVTTMRNEAPHILDWIAHHHAAGVERFLVYTNDCEDGTDEILQLLPCVTHVPLAPGDGPPQWRALKAAWRHPVVQDADWLACLDCDEYIRLNKGLEGIPDLIAQVGGDAILMPWRLFGHSGQITSSDRPTPDRFTRAAPEDLLYPALATHFKTLFRREGPFRAFGVHRPKQKSPEKQGRPQIVSGSGAPVTGALQARDGQILNWGAPIANDLVQLNHYSVRSVAEFMVKTSRGLPNHQDKDIDLTYWVERNFNAVEDTSIAHMAEGRDAVLRAFRDIPGLVALEARGRQWHKTRLQEILATPEGLKLFGRIILAGSSQVPERNVALHLIKAYGEVHGQG